MAVEWARKIVDRPGQAHVFDDAGRSLCRTLVRSEGLWEPAGPAGRLCATCRRKVDPAGAPKAPKVRR